MENYGAETRGKVQSEGNVAGAKWQADINFYVVVVGQVLQHQAFLRCRASDSITIEMLLLKEGSYTM